MTLRAPVAIPVEIRSGGRRHVRLSRAVGADGLRLERPAPFDPGRPAQIRFALPGGDAADGDEDGGGAWLELRAVVSLTDEDGEGEHGGRELAFRDPPADARAAVERYVTARLQLPARF